MVSRTPVQPATRAMALLAVVVTGVAFAPSLPGPFLFDDVGEIERNPALSILWPPAVAMLEGGRLPHRPLSYYSFAISRALGGIEPFGFRVVNLAIHLVNGLLVGWLVMRGMRRSDAARASPLDPAWMGACVAAVWLVHPLASQPVAYIYQRMELLAAGCILATLACFEQSLASPRPARWLAGSFVSCAIGMGCKETAAVAPLLVALYHALVGAGGGSAGLAAMRRRGGFYALLAASWLVLALVVLSQRQRYAEWREAEWFSAADTAMLPPWRYLLEQSRVILQYLRLALWPSRLCFDYGWQPAETVASLVVPVVAVAAAVASGALLVRTRPRAAFLILAFFTLLAPTSSIAPVADLCVEHRMYLPLAAVVAAVFGGLAAGLVRVGPAAAATRRVVAVTGLLVIVLACVTHARMEVYRSRLALWGDTVGKAPRNPRAWVCLGRALLDAGEHEAAERAIAEALRLAPDSGDAMLQLGNAVRDRDPAGALALYRRAVELDPRNLAARTNLAAMLGMRGDPEAEAHLRAVLAEDAWNVEAMSNYGNVCLMRGDTAAARMWFGRATALAPEDPVVRRKLEIATAAEEAAAEATKSAVQSAP